MQSIRDSAVSGTHKFKGEGREKDIPYKWKLKERRNSYIYIRQNKLEVKKCNETKWSLYDDKEVNSPRECNNYNYLFTQHQNA